jgi:hypothetical protein
MAFTTYTFSLLETIGEEGYRGQAVSSVGACKATPIDPNLLARSSNYGTVAWWKENYDGIGFTNEQYQDQIREKVNIQSEASCFFCDTKIHEQAVDPLPNRLLFMAIIGSAGTGKTSMLVNLLSSKQAYRKAFHHVHVVMPSQSVASLKRPSALFTNTPAALTP